MPHKRTKAQQDYRRQRGVTRRAGLPDPPPIPEALRLNQPVVLTPRCKWASRAVLKPRPEVKLSSNSPTDPRPQPKRVGRSALPAPPAYPPPSWKRARVATPALPTAKRARVGTPALPTVVKTEVKVEVKQEAEPSSSSSGLAPPVSVGAPALREFPEFPGTPTEVPSPDSNPRGASRSSSLPGSSLPGSPDSTDSKK